MTNDINFFYIQYIYYIFNHEKKKKPTFTCTAVLSVSLYLQIENVKKTVKNG